MERIRVHRLFDSRYLYYLFVFTLILAGTFLYLYKLYNLATTYDETFFFSDAEIVWKSLDWTKIEAARYPPLLYYLVSWVNLFPSVVHNFSQRLIWSRLTMLPFFWLGAVSLFYFTMRHFGRMAALIGLALFVCNPEILAHSRLWKADYLFSVFLFIFIMSFNEVFRSLSLKWTIIAGLSLGLTFLARSSSLLILPVIFSFMAVVTFKSPQMLKCLGVFLCAILIALYLIHASYVFKETGTLSPVWQSQKFIGLYQHTLSRSLMYLFPDAYIRGLDDAVHISENGWGNFLAGRHTREGIWYYFPAVFLIKTPLAFLVLIGVLGEQLLLNG